jgi:hypothetical protein
VNRRLGTLLVTGWLTLFAGCGGDGDSTAGSTSPPRPRHEAPARPTGVAAVCASIPIEEVRSLISAAGGRQAPLRRHSSSTSGRSICRFHGRTVNVEAQLDVATRAVTRYFNRITESQQFSSTNPGLRPVPVPGLGDSGVPGGGANWIPYFDQLLSARGEAALLVNFYAQGAANEALKQEAIRFTRLVYAKLGLERGRHHSDDRSF